MQETEAVLRAKEVARKTGLSLSAGWDKTKPKNRCGGVGNDLLIF